MYAKTIPWHSLDLDASKHDIDGVTRGWDFIQSHTADNVPKELQICIDDFRKPLS
jgi:hypothetical protein